MAAGFPSVDGAMQGWRGVGHVKQELKILGRVAAGEDASLPMTLRGTPAAQAWTPFTVTAAGIEPNYNEIVRTISITPYPLHYGLHKLASSHGTVTLALRECAGTPGTSGYGMYTDVPSFNRHALHLALHPNDLEYRKSTEGMHRDGVLEPDDFGTYFGLSGVTQISSQDLNSGTSAVVRSGGLRQYNAAVSGARIYIHDVFGGLTEGTRVSMVCAKVDIAEYYGISLPDGAHTYATQLIPAVPQTVAETGLPCTRRGALPHLAVPGFREELLTTSLKRGDHARSRSFKPDPRGGVLEHGPELLLGTVVETPPQLSGGSRTCPEALYDSEKYAKLPTVALAIGAAREQRY